MKLIVPGSEKSPTGEDTVCVPLVVSVPPLFVADTVYGPPPDHDAPPAYPEMAPWALFVAESGRCKFMSTKLQSPSTLSLTQMIQESPERAESYARNVGSGMAKSYDVTPDPAIGKAGAAVREKTAGSRMLTLIGHQKNVVVMAQLSFYGGVSAAQQTIAEQLTQETFTADTGGGLKMPGE